MKNFYFTLFISLVFISCNKDYKTVGLNLIDNNTFRTNLEEIPLSVKMRNIPPYVSNTVTTFQIGEYNDNIYGLSKVNFLSQVNFEDPNLVFGDYSQSNEDNPDGNISRIQEIETIKNVFLDIPFYTNIDDDDNDGVINIYDVDSTDPYSDSDGDGVSDADESNLGQNPLDQDTDGDGILDGEDTESINPHAGRTLYELDSLIGNPEATFKLKVSELDYFLRPYDPDSNFEKFQKYYSNNTLPENFSGYTLFDSEVKIDSNELVFYNEDDPETEEEDESEVVKERLSPRIRVDLDHDFFQTKFLDIEGSQEISNLDNFKLYFKGLVLEAYDFSDPLLMILNFNEAEIKVVYEYQKYNTQDTTDDTSDDTVDTEEADFLLKLNGIKLNSFKHDPYPGYVYSAIADTVTNPERVYLKGGQGIMAEIELFKDDNGVDVLEEIRSKEWLVNEANISIYIDKEMLSSSGGIIEPSRLYLYDLVNKAPIIDYFVDNSAGQKSYQNKVIHGGIIELDDDKNGLMYKIRISEHIKNVVRKDSTNVKLGLVVSSDINNTINIEVKDSEYMLFTPLSSAINPLGTVLIGPSPSAENFEKRMKLNLFYTEVNN
ncbi:DUF4270 family protein [Flavobacteriaceae bacterium]|nr:DUF4270 family protein [Flavobacteriaceae bacterium]MDC1337328.1 DUF4270 family protein [Flavobacteriaceae bacterium]MDC1337346.1 DUF4270 family protein [Flavobacteriaceae bacterium]MDC1456528.1 DUF4270 family protein [Flavobacteriaceae bacterium]